MISPKPDFERTIDLMTHVLSLLFAILLFSMSAAGQGRRGMLNATPEQTAAIARMNTAMAPQVQRLASARSDLVTTTLSLSADDAAIRARAQAIRAAELELAKARAAAFAEVQSSSNRLNDGQVAALAGGGGPGGAGRGGYRTSMPHVTAKQAAAMLEMNTALQSPTQALNSARTQLTLAVLSTAADDAAILSKIDAVEAAELALARARAGAFGKIQSSSDRLDSEQVAWLVGAGGTYGTGFTEPEPMDFEDHRGYVSLFDGVSLKGWDGNPKFWRVENGAIVGESTLQNPSGNQYIAYRDVVAKDFTLKFEIKVEGPGGSGLQYRSKTGLPWLRPIPANVAANVGPVNFAWMMTGPQADFWPSQIYTGQFYSENTPMGIMSFRGQVVEGAGLGAKRLMGTIGDRAALGNLVKASDWNQYTVIARGGTFIHIVNGQLMAVMVDDDPDSSNNQPGIFGIEIEATTKVSVRNIWLKKLN
jgi:hypothetical protein